MVAAGTTRPRNPFQIGPGVAVAMPLVAAKDCTQRPWVRLNPVVTLAHCIANRCDADGGAGGGDGGMDGGVDSARSTAELPFFSFFHSLFLHINKTAAL